MWNIHGPLDKGGERPNPDAYEAAWKVTHIISEEPAPAMIKLRDLLSENYLNGGACVARFRITAPPEVLWGLRNDKFAEFGFLDRFFAHPVVTAALPEVIDRNERIREFKSVNTTDGFGHLLGSVIYGGLYGRFNGSSEDALKLLTEFMRAAVGMRLTRANLWMNYARWTDWFLGVAWDSTYVWFDPVDSAITVLLITDSD